MAIFTVSNTNDSGSGSLTQAILDANAIPGADNIQFSIPIGSVIPLAFQEFIVTDDLTINGDLDNNGSADITLRKLPESFPRTRFFRIDDSDPTSNINVTINGLILRDGGDAFNTSGGAIFNNENLIVINTSILNNVARDGGGIFNNNFGKLTIANSILNANFAARGDNGSAIFNIGGTSINYKSISV